MNLYESAMCTVNVKHVHYILHKGPSIYDVHTEGRGQAQVDACGRGEGSEPCGRQHKNYSSLTSFWLLLMQRSWRFLGPEFRLWTE